VDDVSLGLAPVPPGYYHWEHDREGLDRLFNIGHLPGGKTDANNQQAAFLSSDLPEENWAWSDAFAARLRDYTLGRADGQGVVRREGVPADYTPGLAQVDLAREVALVLVLVFGEAPLGDLLAEALRQLGIVLREPDHALRPPVHADSVTGSHYDIESHTCHKREPGRVHLDGFISYPTALYTVPYRIMVPEAVDGLLVSVAISASHMGYGSLRMEPCWMALDEAAGLAAILSRRAGTEARDIPIPELQERLLDHGAVLAYVSNVGTEDPRFRAVQHLVLQRRVPGMALKEETAR
jgi:hypothetical protein